MKRIIILPLLLCLFAAYVRLVPIILEMRPVPQCHEDVVLVGIGDFDNGRWDKYVCGPALDDCLASKQWQPYIP